VQPLAYADDQRHAANSSITLEGGQEISFVFSPASESSATVDISYRETNPFRAPSFWFHQLARPISGGSSQIARMIAGFSRPHLSCSC